MHWALAECIGDYALTKTQQKLGTDCRRVLFIVAKDAGTLTASCPYPAAMRVASPDSQ
jgi:hypothetical protein